MTVPPLGSRVQTSLFLVYLQTMHVNVFCQRVLTDKLNKSLYGCAGGDPRKRVCASESLLSSSVIIQYSVSQQPKSKLNSSPDAFVHRTSSGGAAPKNGRIQASQGAETLHNCLSQSLAAPVHFTTQTIRRIPEG